MRFIRIENNFRNISIYGNETQPYICNEWICTNDFIFTVVLVLNIGELLVFPQICDGLLQDMLGKTDKATQLAQRSHFSTKNGCLG